MTKLKSAKQELSDCRAAWTGAPKAKLAWSCHHQILIEPLTEPYNNRIRYILSNKDSSEHAVRFRNFRPVRVALPPELDKAYAELDKANAEWYKADVEWYKADAELDKAYAKLDKAYAEWYKARAEWHKKLTDLHKQDWPDHTWNGKDIGI